MGLNPAFPKDPHIVLDPAIRWYPGDEIYSKDGYATLLPPLVYKIRKGVKAWRDKGYEGASPTTRALLNHWFNREHLLPTSDGLQKPFCYYFAQREAVESAIWLYEVEQARDPYALINFDSSGRVSKGMFSEDWTRYVMKLATGAGKTKVMSLLIAWSYFHKKYEDHSDLSTNFLLIAPNIIVLDRLRVDFDGLRIFYNDPILPPNGYEGQNWEDDFQITLHVQDEVRGFSESGNIFLSNIHRIYERGSDPTFEDSDTTDYFLGQKPTGKTNESGLDLSTIVRRISDLVVINDEAHHVHNEELAWFKCIQDISNNLRLRGSKLSAQFDLSATPKHDNGAIFVQTISDYPLVEAIRQGVVKTPVLPDSASRAKLSERTSDRFTEMYRDYLHLGYLEWKKSYEVLRPSGKKSVLFIMTDDTRNCDEVGEFLETYYPELKDAVLVIHTKKNGEISEAASGKNKDELEKLRKDSREIDELTSRYKAIVSVMVLREGWDVQNVVAIVGLRPYKAKSQILPEQTLGRGLRRMFRGEKVTEKVSVVGTEAFIEFVESIKSEGVELEYAEMGERTKPQAPLVVEVDRDNKKKDIERLDIELPILAPRIYREYKNLEEIDSTSLPHPKLPIKQFSAEEQREIIFKDIDTEQVSHKTVLDSDVTPSYQSVVGYFAKKIMQDLRLVRGTDILFGKIKTFIEERLFERSVNLEDLNILRNLSEIEAIRFILESFKTAINALTVQDRGTTEIRDWIRLGKTRPFVVDWQEYVIPKKCIFNKIVGDSHFELEFSSFLDDCQDLISFAKNSESTHFRIEYRTAEGGIANYYPDFVVKEADDKLWLIETKGREDLDDPKKWERLKEWCKDATKYNLKCAYTPLFVREERYKEYQPKTFKDLCKGFEEK